MHYKKTNGEKIKIFGIPTADVYIKGKQKPIDKPKSPQYRYTDSIYRLIQRLTLSCGALIVKSF